MALRAAAGRGVDRAVRVPGHGGALPALSAGLDIEGQSGAGHLALLPPLVDLAPQSVVIRGGAQTFEGLAVAAGIEHRPRWSLVRHLFGFKQIAPADPDRIEPGHASGPVDQPLHEGCRFGPARPAIDADGA